MIFPQAQTGSALVYVGFGQYFYHKAVVVAVYSEKVEETVGSGSDSDSDSYFDFGLVVNSSAFLAHVAYQQFELGMVTDAFVGIAAVK